MEEEVDHEGRPRDEESYQVECPARVDHALPWPIDYDQVRTPSRSVVPHGSVTEYSLEDMGILLRTSQGQLTQQQVNRLRQLSQHDWKVYKYLYGGGSKAEEDVPDDVRRNTAMDH